MTLKILWFLHILVVMNIIGYIYYNRNWDAVLYILAYVSVLGGSIYFQKRQPKLAILLAALPVALPVLVFVFLAVVFILHDLFK